MQCQYTDDVLLSGILKLYGFINQCNSNKKVLFISVFQNFYYYYTVQKTIAFCQNSFLKSNSLWIVYFWNKAMTNRQTGKKNQVLDDVWFFD